MPRVGDAAALRQYVRSRAPSFNLDPEAPLAVAAQEGLGGGIGDQGTSFGPWQLHAGGALPAAVYQGPYSDATQAWAWSPEGIDYALSRMASVGAAGQSGAQAISTIVSKFERPADIPGETARAISGYSGDGSTSPYQTPARPGDPAAGGNQEVGLFGSIIPDIGGVPGDIWGAGKGILGGATDTFGALKGFFTAALWLVDPMNWLRAFEALVGTVMIMFGLYYFGKAEGSADVKPTELLKDPRKLGSGATSGSQRVAKRAASGSLVGKGSRAALKVAPAGRAAKAASKVAAKA